MLSYERAKQFLIFLAIFRLDCLKFAFLREGQTFSYFLAIFRLKFLKPAFVREG